MSTRPRSRTSTRVAAKRRAAARRRTRELSRHLFAYIVIAILVLGTVSTVIVAQVPVGTTPAVSATATPTSSAARGLGQLITQADQNAAAGKWDDAIGLYIAYLAQDPGNAEVLFKLGKAYISKPDPDYLRGLDYLQRALKINPDAPFADEARSLMEQYKSAAEATATASSAITTTATVSGTTVPAATTPASPTTAVTTAVTVTSTLTPASR